MATLTETAYYSRKAINLLAIVAVGFIILKILWSVGSAIFSALFPPGPPPADTAFNQIPYPSAENGLATPSGTITYKLETVGNELPTIPKTMKVYFMPKAKASFDSSNQIRQIGAKLGFNDSPRLVGKSLWQFVDSENPLRDLKIDQVSFNFHLTYNYAVDQNLFNERSLNTSDSTTAISALQQAVGIPPDLATGKQVTNYLRLENGKLVSATSLSTADAMSIVFNRPDIDNIKVVSPDPKMGLVSITISPSSNTKKQILDMRYYYSPIQMDSFGTYPLIPSTQAFTQLQKNEALFASLPSPIPETVTIRDVYIAYLDPYPAQNYLQPVLVFTDTKDFTAYVPLVTPQWLIR